MEDRLNDNAPTREDRWALLALAAVVVITAAWWALALWPAGNAPQWLARTQEVCFGVRANGLPDAAGWTGLIASPLGMLALLLVSARASFSRVLKRMTVSPWLKLYAAVLAIFVTAGAAGAAVRIRAVSSFDAAPTANSPRAPLMGQRAPSLRLTNQFGELTDLAALRGKPVLVTFAYAHCETVCPIIVHDALQLQQARSAAGEAAPLLLIVTLDPRRDTPARLPTIAREWQVGENAFVLSGSVADVEQVLDEWRIARNYNATDGSVAHTAVLYEIDADGVIVRSRP